jgi:hypothetical protein
MIEFAVGLGLGVLLGVGVLTVCLAWYLRKPL